MASQVLTDLLSQKVAISNLGIKRVGLFGSTVRGQDTPTSDIDLLVEFETGKKSYRNLLSFAELAESLLHKPVELVTPESLSPYISPHIMQEVQYVQIS